MVKNGRLLDAVAVLYAFVPLQFLLAWPVREHLHPAIFQGVVITSAISTTATIVAFLFLRRKVQGSIILFLLHGLFVALCVALCLLLTCTLPRARRASI